MLGMVSEHRRLTLYEISFTREEQQLLSTSYFIFLNVYFPITVHKGAGFERMLLV